MIGWASYPYTGTVVLVTGAGSGIGRSIARAFLEQNATVCVIGRREEPLRQTVVGHPSERAFVRIADVTDRASIDAVIGEIDDRFGRLDTVVNNAGVFEVGPIDHFDDAAWERVRSVNLDGVITVTRAAVPMLLRTQGNVVSISSATGVRGEWGQFAYSATKGAVNAMTQSLALDLGPRGVRVNAIAPSFTATEYTSGFLMDPVFATSIRNRVPQGRATTPEDVARVALFLASPDAGRITGAVIPVDGGMTASTGHPHQG